MLIKHSTVNISGDYWDSYFNDDNVYLWKTNGEVLVLDINKLRGSISSHNRSYEEKDLQTFIDKRTESPFKYQHTDIGIYQNKLYSLTDEGLFESYLNSDTNQIKNGTDKIWDAVLFSLKIKENGRMALSAGNDGLFEYDLNNKFVYSNNKYFKRAEKKRDIFEISSNHSLFSNWVYSSIYSTSNKGKSFIAGFNWIKGTTKFIKVINQREIFSTDKKETYSWGIGDEIYRIVDGGLEYVKFTQSHLNTNKSAFSQVERINFQPWKGKIIYASAADFGVVIECENALVVMKDRDTYFNIPGQITRWRVFCDNNKQNNQLHVIFDNKMTIYFF